VKVSTFSGQQIAQVNNPDPFAVPIWRSPVYHTPGWLITLIQAWRLIAAVIKFIIRHPVADLTALALAGSWYLAGWPGPLALLLLASSLLLIWRWRG
jgi:hypothetical protein